MDQHQSTNWAIVELRKKNGQKKVLKNSIIVLNNKPRLATILPKVSPKNQPMVANNIAVAQLAQKNWI